MRKVIGGKIYDTDTAELLYTENGTHRSFYMTPNGAFFTLYPTGEIKPRTEENAKAYLGEHNADKYIQIFGEVEEA